MKSKINIIRIIPSQSPFTLHLMLLQYLNRVAFWEWAISDLNMIPCMDLSYKVSGFHSPDDTDYKENVWLRWFEQPKLKDRDIWWAEDTSEQGDLIISFPTLENLKRFNAISNKYLKFKPHILQKVNNFVKDNFKGKVVGLHLRGSDCYIDNLRPKIPLAYYKDIIEEHLSEYDTIYIATDTIEFREYFSSLYPNKVIFYPTKNISSLEFDSAFNSLHEHPIDLSTVGEDVLIESVLLSKVDLLIKQRSNVSFFSRVLNPHLKTHQIDFKFLFKNNKDYAFSYDDSLEVKKHNYYWDKVEEFSAKHNVLLNNGGPHGNKEQMKSLINKYLL